MLARIRPARNGETQLTSLIRFIEQAVEAGVDLIQLRERDLSARALYRLTEAVVSAARGTGARVLVNDRADVAASLGAGVHLTTRSMTASALRHAFGDQLLIGASTHNLAEVEAAERSGADFVVFGPVFETESKREYGAPVGVESLRVASARTRIPVLALGGINTSNFRDALDAGAAGVAGISIFINCFDLKGLVLRLKSPR